MKWFNVRFMYDDFKRDWDIGRTIIVSTIGYFDKYRESLTHLLYWNLRLVPYPKIAKKIKLIVGEEPNLAVYVRFGFDWLIRLESCPKTAKKAFAQHF